MGMIGIKILNHNSQTLAARAGEKEVQLVYANEYKEGDRIIVETDSEKAFLVIQLDDAIGESFVYVTSQSVSFEVPFGEKKICYSPKSFSDSKHLLTARYAEESEIASYRNLALNKYDQHGDPGIFPHASANVETRGESVFAAKNAINGNHENHSHGEWPYESWGINRNPDAVIRLDFARQVLSDKMRLYLRADFPHDSWWKQVTVRFSDGAELIWNLEKTDQAQVLVYEERQIEWAELCKLIKCEDHSPFPALSQWEIYGK